MISDGYERLRERLEEQLRADIELLQEAYRVKMRALETVAHARGEIAVPSVLVADSRPALPPGSPPAEAAAPAAPAPVRKRSRAFAIHDAVEDALEQVGETFDRNDLCAALGFKPSRATLYRVLSELIEQRRIAFGEPVTGNQPTRYRKLAASPPPEEANAPS
jgi:hypothetical protein